MKCKKVKRLISAYFDNELPFDLKSRVQEHLSRCQDCKGELDGERFLRNALLKLDSPEPSYYLFARILGRLKKKKTLTKFKALIYAGISLVIFVFSAATGSVVGNRLIKYSEKATLEKFIQAYGSPIFDEPEYLLSNAITENEEKNER